MSNPKSPTKGKSTNRGKGGASSSSSQPKKKNSSNTLPEDGDNGHRFQKKTFSHPTWCPFANKFIWGLDKGGYECRVCSLTVSRKFISEAKKTVCGASDSGALVVETPSANETAAVTKGQYFTIYLPHGAKKSVLLKPSEPLRNVLEKVCQARGIDINEFVPEDVNGQAIDLGTVLGNIEGNEITFTKRDNTTSHKEKSSNKEKPRDEDRSETKSKKNDRSDKKPNHTDSKQKTNSVTSITSTNSVPTVPAKKKNIIEQYELGPELGSGAFSVVRSATHVETGQVVAIKVIDKYEDDDEQTQKFKQEIAIISSLKHENIVQFYELDEDDENFYVVMELVGGGELFDYIIDNKTIPEKESVLVVAQVLKAIEYMHSVGTAHRDLKPENLLYKTKNHDTIKIADFGESKSFREGSLTTYCGTPDYMAPEIIKGDPYGSEVDVWAIGVITYVMLAGFPPFDGENDVEVFASILAIRYDFPSPEWDNISLDARDFISSIFVEDPKKRVTASEALKHPWIVSNVPADLRTNKPREEEIKTKSSKQQLTGDPNEIDWNNQPKTQLKNKLKEVTKLVNDDNPLMGELKAIQSILDVTVGKQSVALEKKIYEVYWRRLTDIQAQVNHHRKKK